MRRTLVLILVFFPYLLWAQPRTKPKKYPSLLWEISGNGLAKPSYLFGTMHVSNKLAFHLADSFFLGIRSADVVALETNPESWQEDMSNYDLGGGTNLRSYNGYESGDYVEMPGEYLRLNTLKFYQYDKKIERALYSNPSTINNLLYRSYGSESSDFEEDTYLDMYIYQCGKKWGKKVAGVERYAESMKLMMEAYKDAAKDRIVRERSYDNENSYSFNKLQEAYRSGNLDWLDSINKYNSFSPSFDEKFLYRRNEIQANSIDSILRSGQSLFVGVGAAHLPGNRGVIEMLRRAGYSLRPVKMGARDSQHKNEVEKVRVAVPFATQVADDGMFKVDIPGKFYKFGEDPSLDQRQYADMANGSYYMVTRVMTNAWMWGHPIEKVTRIVDSLLYENIPGKIISRSRIFRNGYNGIDLTNKTRRGDIQRYNIFITPFEVIIFKMSGTGDYVRNGVEARKFFGSIQLKEYSRVGQATAWKAYSPSYGGFRVDLPHEPQVGNDGSWIFDATDRNTGSYYRVIRTDIHNYDFAEEDSFDLALMAESFEASDFIQKAESRKPATCKGYPALDCKYTAKNGSVYLARFIIQGPHYYTLVANGKREHPSMHRFLNSFALQPYTYPAATTRNDSNLYYTVNTPVFPVSSKEKLDVSRYNYTGEDDDELNDESILENGAYRSRIISNDSTGEKIFVSFFKMQRYQYIGDSARISKENQLARFSDSSGFARHQQTRVLPNGMKVWESIITDTGSSRTIRSKTFYKNGIGYSLLTQGDTISQPSAFVRAFFDSFDPVDTIKGMNPFTRKSDLFFADFASTDSVAHKRALRHIYAVKLDSADLPQLKETISRLDWNEKKYIDVKKELIGKLDDIPANAASDYLEKLYYAAGDTLELQHKALETLLRQRTSYAYDVFANIMANDPPVLETSRGNRSGSYIPYLNRDYTVSTRKFDYSNGSFMDELQDSLKLTAAILPELLPLLNVDDYKNTMMHLLAQLVDSSLIHQQEYEAYFSRLLMEAKHEMKKQLIAEKKKAIELAEKIKLARNGNAARIDRDEDTGNGKLDLYAILLMPWWDSHSSVPAFFDQALLSADNRLKFHTLLLLVRNHKPFPGNMLNYFASLDEYRYDLYTELAGMGRSSLFPASFRNQKDLAKSVLLSESSYEQPDSVQYLEKLDARVKNRKGYVYFFKYKMKRDDAGWKIASVGLVPGSPDAFEFNVAGVQTKGSYRVTGSGVSRLYDLTDLSDTRLSEEQPVTKQLEKELKRLTYSRRKSAKEFYEKTEIDSYYSNLASAED